MGEESKGPGRLVVLDAMLRHPLAAILLGFVLTGVVGTTLTNHLSSVRQQEADAMRLRDMRREAIRSLSRALSERVARMQVLIRAIERRGSPQLIAEAYKLYEETEARWLVSRSDHFLLAREILGESDYESFRSGFETRLARGRMQPLKEALERACAVAQAGGDGADVLQQSNAAQLLQEAVAGSEVIVDSLYDLSGISALNPNSPHAMRVREQMRRKLEAACPVTVATQPGS